MSNKFLELSALRAVDFEKNRYSLKKSLITARMGKGITIYFQNLVT
jgi:hypothetical protein